MGCGPSINLAAKRRVASPELYDDGIECQKNLDINRTSNNQWHSQRQVKVNEVVLPVRLVNRRNAIVNIHDNNNDKNTMKVVKTLGL